jgi:cytochrome c peroxidase
VKIGDPSLLAGIPGEGPLVLSTLTTWLSDPANHVPLEYELPAWLQPGVGQVKDLADNPPTRAKLELGRQLFFDPRLSRDGTVSCGTCHEPEHGFTVATALARGTEGRKGRRNPPALLNRIMLAVGDDRQMWDGRASSVEDALLHALTDATAMAADSDETLAKLRDLECYRIQFETSYGGVSWSALGDAIGQFVHCLVTGDGRCGARRPPRGGPGGGRAQPDVGSRPPGRIALLRQPGLVQRLPQRRQLHRRAVSQHRRGPRLARPRPRPL